MRDLKTIRTDVVGSLLRPDYLKGAREMVDEGQMDADELREAENRAVREAVALQEAAGLDVITDGEMRRLNFQDSFGASVSGFDAAKADMRFYETRVHGAAPLQRWEFPVDEKKATAVSQRRPVVEKLKLAHNLPLEEYQFVKSVAKKPVKVTLIGPDRIAQRFDHQRSKAIYPTMDDFMSDDPELGRRRMPLHSDRRARIYRVCRQALARRDARARRRSDGKLRALDQGRQRGDPGLRRRNVRHPHLPRQSAQHVAPRGHLRSHRGEAS
jgi:hypothetical protein